MCCLLLSSAIFCILLIDMSLKFHLCKSTLVLIVGFILLQLLLCVDAALSQNETVACLPNEMYCGICTMFWSAL